MCETSEPTDFDGTQERKTRRRLLNLVRLTLDLFDSACTMARNASHFAANWPTSRSNEFRQKKSKKKRPRPTHGFLHLNLKRLIRQAHERSCKLMSFRSGFFEGDQSWPLHDEKLPNSYSPVVFPSVLKHLSSDTVKGCSSSS